MTPPCMNATRPTAGPSMRAGSVAAGMRGSSSPTTVTSCRSQLPGLRIALRRERVRGQPPACLRERLGVEMLDPAIVGEGLEGRHPPVLRSRRRPDPEHHRRSDREVDARVARVPEEAHVPRAAAGERVPPPPVDPASAGREPGHRGASGHDEERGGERDADDASPGVTRPEDDRRPQERREREEAQREGVSVLEENRREADPEGHRRSDDPRPAGRRAESGEQCKAERDEDDEPVERPEADGIERRLHGGRVAETVPRVARSAVGPRVESGDDGEDAADDARREAPPQRPRRTAASSARKPATRNAPHATGASRSDQA